MGLLDLTRRLGHQPWFARVGRALVPLDRRIQRATGGRWGVMGRHVVPEFLLTTTGRTSGLPRSVPLLYARDGDAFVVIASNWGQAKHPAWSGNLLAQPRASVAYQGRDVDVIATLAEGEERERLWPKLIEVWPAYDTYAARSGRDLRVFRLEPMTWTTS